VSCYRKILVAVDGSPDAEAALEHAITLARDQNATLTLLTVIPPPPKPVGAGVAPPQDLTDLYVKILREAVESVPGDVGVTSRLEHGPIAESILRIAGEDGHDLLVMGSHGHSRMRRALLGSVSERLLHSAAIPVLMMRAELGS
jgi:nucleotide-binding universal stress UspA family protein